MEKDGTKKKGVKEPAGGEKGWVQSALSSFNRG